MLHQTTVRRADLIGGIAEAYSPCKLAQLAFICERAPSFRTTKSVRCFAPAFIHRKRIMITVSMVVTNSGERFTIAAL